MECKQNYIKKSADAEVETMGNSPSDSTAEIGQGFIDIAGV